MAAFVYRCPITGQRVQGWIADAGEDGAHHAVTCLACQRVHLVDPKTGMVLGDEV
jgi:hypothetical protein